MPDLEYNDDQDQSEVFDEDNQNLDGEGQTSPMDMRTLEELPDVLDVTAEAPVSDSVPVFDRAEGPVSSGRRPAERRDEVDQLGVDIGVEGELASFEADTVDDEDLEDLGYSEIGPDGEAHAIPER